ncbi:hypothetical protein D8797_04045 [Streptococcus cristatus]|nr:hypothetical protein D8797_04045 [Streptococcus cristatus]
MFYINYYTIFLKNMKTESFLKIRKDKSLFFIVMYIIVYLRKITNVSILTCY